MSSHKAWQKGFTLVEVLVAIAILLIGALAFVPLFVYAREVAENNNRRAVAASLANSEMEKIRAMEFSQVGFQKGEPKGIIEKEEEILTINGVEYLVQRNISWISQGSDCAAGDSSDPLWDAKFVQIVVSTNAPNSKRQITETMETIVSRSVYQEASPGYGIRICAFRGWQGNEKDKVPVGGVKVSIDGPRKTWTSTNNRGVALFFLEKNEVGRYMVTVQAPASMMVMPGDEQFELTVNETGKWAKKSVLVEYPCWLDLTLRDARTGKPVNAASYRDTYLLIRSRFNPQGDRYNISSPVVKNIGPLWPLGPGETGSYGLSLRNVPGYHDAEGNEYFLKTERDSVTPWDGFFAEPGARLPLAVHLIPVPGPDAGRVIEATDTSLNWLNGITHTVRPNPAKPVAADDEGHLLHVLWQSGDITNSIQLKNNDSSLLTASAMFLKQNLEIEDALLQLVAEVHVFEGWIKLATQDQDGQLRLLVPEGCGIPGSTIQGGDPSRLYGEVHFVKGVFTGDPLDEENCLAKGAYYFPHGAELPGDVNLLVPMRPGRWP